MSTSNHHHTYQLYIRLSRTITIPVGALGQCRFPAGDYIYTGSARRNMEARLRRHRGRDKRPHWHIDHLLLHPAASVVEVTRSATPECELNQSVTGEIPAPGFGASDCRNGCGSHLKLLLPRQSKAKPHSGRPKRSGPRRGAQAEVVPQARHPTLGGI